MSNYSKKKQEYIELIIFSLILYGTYLTSFYSYLLFHTIAELFSIIIAGGIFVIAWNSRKNIDNSFFLVVGISFLYVGIIDLLHTLAYTGMNIFVEYDTNLPASLWIAARYLQAFSFLCATLVINRRIKINYLHIGYTIITIILLFLIFMGLFPICYIEGSGLTPFKIISEYIIDLILFITILVMYKYRVNFEKKIFIFIISSIIATMIAEIAFTFYVNVYGLSNLIGHIFKIIACFLLYKAIIEIGLKNPFNLLFKKLKDSEFAYRMLYEDAPNAYFSIGTDKSILRWNKYAEKLLGYTKDELSKLNVLDLYANTENGLVKAKYVFNRFLKGENIRDEELQMKHKNGKSIWISLSVRPVLDPKGNVIESRSMVIDISERKKAEEIIYNLAKFPSENPYPVLRVSKKGVIYSNKAGEDVFNIKKNAPIPLLLRNEVKNVLSENKIATVEKSIDNKIYLFVITPVEGVNYVNIYGLDTTDRKQAERRLEQLVSTVSHELRTPITVLLMSLDYLKNHKETITQEVEERLMEGISRNITLLNKLAEDILMISRIDEKRLELDWFEYSPLEVINEILTLMKPIAKNKNITLEVDIDENIHLMGDPKRIDQIFRILIDNAIKYSEPESKIEIKGIDNYVGNYNRNHEKGILFQFKDYGRGIPKKDLPHLFERFFRSDQVKEISGTGLGLSIAKELTQLHKGEIFVESEFGKGSTFFVFLPKIDV